MIGELVTTALLQACCRREATAAIRGEITPLYVWEQQAIKSLVAAMRARPRHRLEHVGRRRAVGGAAKTGGGRLRCSRRFFSST
jgi:hypothetical protein